MLRTYVAAVLLGIVSASLATAYETLAYRADPGQAGAWMTSPEPARLVVQRPDGVLCAYVAGVDGHSLRCR